MKLTKIELIKVSFAIMLILGITIFYGISLVSAEQCKDIVEIAEIPCEVQTSTLNCSGNAFISNSNNISVNSSAVMTLIDSLCTTDCIYNLSFNYLDIAGYTIELCDNKTYSQISVVEKRVTTATTNNINWVGQDIQLKKIDKNAKFTDQISTILSNIFEWSRVMLLRFWWIIVFLFLILIFALSRKKNKEVKK